MGIPKGGIAFFDSGIGGLTVLQACKKRLPQAIFYYYGDNGNAPYGNLPPKTIGKYVRKAFRKFARLQVQAAVLACNTATALCAEALRKKYPFPIIGAEPALRVGAKQGNEVLVLATKATLESPRFQALYRRTAAEFPLVRFLAAPCEGLAGEIEAHLQTSGWDFTSHFPKATPDVVVLGCTHYVYVARQIEAFYRCLVVDGNEGIARRLESVLVALEQKGGAPKEKRGFCKRKEKNFARSQDGIYFLGGYANHNLHIYEQMFVL